MPYRILLAAVILPALVFAQETPSRARRQMVRATGEAILSVKPDQARISVGVTTQAATAQQAIAENATRTTAVLSDLKTLLGSKGELKTANYSVNPQYRYPKEGGTPTITGYSANNTVELTVNDLSLVGKIIDVAGQSGANNINSIIFTLRNDDAARAEAIAQATIHAKANAEAIARALNVRVTGVAEAETIDALAVRPIYGVAMSAKFERAQAPTPVETGNLDISAKVMVALDVAQ